MAFAYNYLSAATTVALNDFNASYNVSGSNNLGFSAYWQPKKTGIVPSISAHDSPSADARARPSELSPHHTSHCPINTYSRQENF
jgi:hypothetical protein